MAGQDAQRLVERTTERIAREAYGRLLAMLVRRTRDIAAAEDCLADALAQALATWPARGVPDRPEAWLLVTARRAAGHRTRHQRVRDAAQPTLEALEMIRQNDDVAADRSAIPDARLGLMFAAAHPAIDAAVRAPLMLQTVLGLDADRIAHAYVVAPATMGQRLVRAKTKIKAAGIGFALPDRSAMPERLDDVLAAIYAAYAVGWDEHATADAAAEPLTHEALYLAELVASLLPGEAEALGLLALMLLCEARVGARRNAAGDYVPLSAQDPRNWDASLLRAGETALRRAAALGRPGRYQTEAAIQSAHAEARMTGRVPVEGLLGLYDLLLARWPSLGGRIAAAAAYGEWRGAAAGLARLDAIEADRVMAYQPYWAARAHLLGQLGHADAAAAARARAALLSRDPAVRAFLSV